MNITPKWRKIMDFSTLCIHGNTEKYDNTGAVSVPIFQSATFAHPGVGESTGYDYTRQQNPTREHLENVIKKLEDGVDAIAFATGMAAIGRFRKGMWSKMKPSMKPHCANCAKKRAPKRRLWKGIAK